jgi:hypothetical protein
VGVVIPLPSQPETSATVTAVHEEVVEVRLADGEIRTVERRANWTSGYLAAAEFTAKSHGWVEPQAFIRDFKGETFKQAPGS